MNKPLLAERIAIIIFKENFNFHSSIRNYKTKLKEYFDEDYADDEIEDSLHSLEEAYIDYEAKQEQQIVELPEDYTF